LFGAQACTKTKRRAVFAAAIPAIISGGIAERAKFYPQLIASAFLVAGKNDPEIGLFKASPWSKQDE